MKKLIPILAAILFVAGTVVSHAQTSTYAIGQSICSKGVGINCSGIPLNAASQTPATVWLDVNPTYGTAWLLFGEGLSHLGQAQINQDASYKPAYGTVSATRDGITKTAQQITSLSLTYYGTDASGNAVNGAMTISFDYYYVWTCSGRACGGVLGWHRRVIGGSTTFTIVSGYAQPLSPIAPTPTCLDSPTTPCPPKKDGQ